MLTFFHFFIFLRLSLIFMTIFLNWTADNFLANLSFVLLFITMLFYWIETAFFTFVRIFKNGVGFIAMVLSNFSLLTLLLLRWKESGHFPLSNLYESLMFLSWSFTSIHILLIRFYFKEVEPLSSTLIIPKTETGQFSSTLVNNGILEKQQDLLSLENNTIINNENTNLINLNRLDSSSLFGSIIAPSALLTNAFATFSLPEEMQYSSALVPALQSNWLVMHVTIMILSYAALIAGCLLSIAFLVMSYLFNQKERDSEKSFAKILDNLSYRLLGIGFPLLTIGILSGAVWANEAWGSYWSWDPKETWALLTWLVFAVYLHTRLTKGWQGRKPAIIASIGFVVVWVCFLGVNLIGKGLHSYGWIQNI